MKAIEGYRTRIDACLNKILPPSRREPAILHRAMRYSVFSGGKRLRPIVVLISGNIFGIEEAEIMPVACGIELMHNFSLIHDDLPAMDNDDFRRGKKTCHRKFGEAVAILAGDALLAFAFRAIASVNNSSLTVAAAEAIGSEGMAGGQAYDIESKDRKISAAFKQEIDGLKTGRLFQLCFSVPFFFRKIDRRERDRINRISNNFGMAFQARDDIEDKEGDVSYSRKWLGVLYRRLKKDIAFFKERGTLLAGLVDTLYDI